MLDKEKKIASDSESLKSVSLKPFWTKNYMHMWTAKWTDSISDELIGISPCFSFMHIVGVAATPWIPISIPIPFQCQKQTI